MIAVVTLPVVVNLALAYFEPAGGGQVGLQLTKTVQVFAIVLVPVAIGMLVRARSRAFAARADRPVRVLSAVVLAAVIVGALVAERADLADYLSEVGALTVLFCLASLTIGYLLPRLVGTSEKQALASAFEVGIHNSTLAIAVAISVLGDERLAVPAAVYGIVMFPLATVAGVVLTRGRRTSPEAPTPAGQPS